MLDTVQAEPEFCCQCGVRDAGGKVDSGKLYCRSCWELLEDMAALKESAASEGAGQGGLWEERCADCGESNADGALETDGTFYCGACWAPRTADAAQGQVPESIHTHGNGEGSPAGERCECDECMCTRTSHSRQLALFTRASSLSSAGPQHAR